MPIKLLILHVKQKILQSIDRGECELLIEQKCCDLKKKYYL